MTTQEITVQRHVRTVTVSRGGAAPVSVYRQQARTVQLAQARGPAGAAGAAGIGSNILYGSGVPASAYGRDGDTYVDTALGTFYRKDGGAWALVANMTGYPGWSPVFAVVADGQRAVFQLVDWTTGTGTNNKPPILSGGNAQYLATTGFTTNIASAFDVRGYAGWSPVYGVASNGNARVMQLTDWTGGTGTKPAILSGGNPQYLSSTGLTTVIADATDVRGPQGIQGIQGVQGIQGETGWSPVFAVHTDTGPNPSRSVLKLVDWTGGTGTKPAILSGGLTQYVGAAGFTTTLASAVDIRGATGPTDPNALAYVIALG